MTDCAIGGSPIVGLLRQVVTVTHPEGVSTCEAHGLVYEASEKLADRLAELLGDDHPFVIRAIDAFDALLTESVCPELAFAEAREAPPITEDAREALDRIWGNAGGAPDWEQSDRERADRERIES